MKLPCGCCAGIQIVTPETEPNRPGLPAIAYRVGTHATFLESMIARLSSLYLDVPAPDGSGSSTRVYPLKQLTTRDPSDPSIALLDAWAVVADVLSFYEERIANEGYLPTATERRSILELARLIGYKLRPGVSASVYLAFTVANGFQGVIPAGTRSQSIPGTGETAQFFETSYDLPARDTWNNIHPRLTRPQVITSSDNPGTDASTRDTLYFYGISTDLKPNDAILILIDDKPSVNSKQQVLRLVDSVNVQADEKRTEAILQAAPLKFDGSVSDAVSAALQPFVREATDIFAGSDLAKQVAELLNDKTGLLSKVSDNTTGSEAASLVQALAPQIRALHDVAVKRKFTRLEPWLSRLLDVIAGLLQQLPGMKAGEGGGGSGATPPSLGVSTVPSALGRLTSILGRVALPPSAQPAGPKQLARTVPQAFSPQADLAPRLLATFHPAAAVTIYTAWSGTETPASQIEVLALRVRTGLFPGTYTGQTVLTQTGTDPNQFTATFTPPSISNSWGPLASQSGGNVPVPLSVIPLDAVYDKIVPESWVAIDRPVLDSNLNVVGRQTTSHKVTAVQTLTRSTNPNPTPTASGMTSKVTQLTLDPPWLQDLTDLAKNNDKQAGDQFNNDLTSPDFLRGTVVYAQPELLDLAEEPLDTDVESDTIELDVLYNGLDSGRWIIVSGERTDIPNTTGVIGNELAMIAAVQQGTSAPLCRPFPDKFVPFDKIYYTTVANRLGDRLVVGHAPKDNLTEILKLPPAASFNQQYCEQAQLADSFFVNAYVPTIRELQKGDFSSFAGLLVDPDTGEPIPNGIIEREMQEKGVFAWRISTEPVHTTLTLAKSLAYSYDSTKVTIYGNVVKATHGQTIGEVLGDGDATQPFDTFALHQKPLTYVSAPTPDGAQSTLVVRVNEIEWHEQPSLAALGPRDRGFVTQTDNSDQTSVIFGNGERGARVPTGTANIKATYRYGIGNGGNVQANQISQLATHPLGVQGVINPLAATGGADRDTLDQGRRNAPVAVKALDRLVSTDDYAEFARTYAGIGKASAVRLSDGHRQLVHITIAGAGDIPIDPNSDLYRNLIQSLLDFGDPHQPLQVCVRKVQLLVIAAGVQVLPDYAWESVEPKIRAAVLDAFGFDNRDLGQSAFLSEAIALMQNIEGVSYVDVQTFDGVPEDITAGQLAGLASTLQRQNHVLAQFARLNPYFDPSTDTDPCQRILPAELIFLTPDIPDTLILNQIGGS